jgi:hypothetical protein
MSTTITTPAKARPTFTLTLRAEPGVDDPIRALRAVVKAALRRHGLRCISAVENEATED